MARVVAVVGGGISGLGAARVLAGAVPASAELGERARRRTEDTVEVVVLEASDRFGGKVLSGNFRGRPVDLGPDNFLTRNQSAAELCDELGIGQDLVAPATSSASVVARGRLHPMPAGLVLGLPPDLIALARSRIVSWPGLARASLDLLPFGGPISSSSLGLSQPAGGGGRTPRNGAGSTPEWSAASILERRLGREVVERLVDPLLGGINAGGLDHLSLRVVAPQVAAALAGQRSVTRALRAMSRRARAAPSTATTARRPFFLGLRGGLGRIVDETVAELRARGVDLRGANPVTALRRVADRYELDTPEGTILVDGVVLAAPGYECARLLVDDVPAAAAELGSIPHSSVALVTLAWPKRTLDRPLVGSGFLAPRCEGGLVTGCTFLSSKWPDTAAPGEVVVRASTGRYGDERPGQMDDDELVPAVLGELRELLGISAPPLESLVQRWPRAFPQYLPGHLDKIRRAEAAIAETAAIALAGPSLGGIGIPACLTSGERAALEVLDRLGV
jgi:oxygen-dependent protoporphyrinogen oxidase